MKKIIFSVVILMLGMILGSVLEYSTMKPEIQTVIKTDTLVIRDTIYKPLNKENVYEQLVLNDVPHPKIVLAQSLLETGNYTSSLCKKHNNIFGMRTSKGYKKYSDYRECILDYKKRISSRYKGGNYYAFLVKIGYAEDSTYVNKLLTFNL